MMKRNRLSSDYYRVGNAEVQSQLYEQQLEEMPRAHKKMLQTMNDGFGVKSRMDSSNISSIMKNNCDRVIERRDVKDDLPKHYQIVGYDSLTVRAPPIQYNTGVKDKRASNKYSATR
jgi:hypothetical protein